MTTGEPDQEIRSRWMTMVHSGALGTIWGFVAVIFALAMSFEVWPPLRELARQQAVADAQAAAVVKEVQEQLDVAEQAVDQIQAAAVEGDDGELSTAVAAAAEAVGGAQGAAGVLEVEPDSEVASETGETEETAASGDQEGSQSGSSTSTSSTSLPTTGTGTGQEESEVKTGFRMFLWQWEEPDADSLLFVFVGASAVLGAGVRVVLANTVPGSRWSLSGGSRTSTTEEMTPERLALYSFIMPYMAAALAIMVFYLLRAGFLGIPSDGADLDQYAIGGLSALVGLGAEEVLDRLKALIETLFTGSTNNN